MKNQFKTQATVTGLKIKTSMVLLAAALIAMITPSAATAGQPSKAPTATLLVSGLEGTQGSTVGPDGALYVSESLAGRIWRVDPETGQVTTFASGLPLSLFGIGNGGVVDVAFIGKTAYALVTGVASDSGGTSVVGIYRVDGPASFTVVADIGEFNLLNPPTIPFKIDVPTGFQFAIETYRGGFLVTDEPQPRAAGHTRRRDLRVHRLRQHRPDRAGGVRRDRPHGRGWPRPPHAPNRQGCVVRAEIVHSYGGSLRRPLGA